MRNFLAVSGILVAASFSGSFVSHAQSMPALPGCEAAPAVRYALDVKLDPQRLEKMKFTERLEFQREVLEDLLVHYPREISPVIRYNSLLSEYKPEIYAALRERWVQLAKNQSDDPLALTIAGKALIGKDTPEGIRLLELAQSKTKAQGTVFPWPSLYLASTYSMGKRADLSKTRENLEAFFAACPSSTDETAQWLLNKDESLQPKVAVALRARLEKETDPKQLKAYETLWGLEFRTRPPKEHDGVRAQVAQDLKHLTSMRPLGDAEWLDLLITGYKQSGATKETVTALEDRLLREFPHSEQAYGIAYERWDKAHPKPEDETDKAAWAKWQMGYEEALKGWISEFTESTYLQRYAWFYTVHNDDWLTENDGIATMDAFLQSVQDYEEPHSRGYDYWSAAEFLVSKKWKTERAFKLLAEARVFFEQDRTASAGNDNLTDQQMKGIADGRIRWDQYIDGLILRAAILTGQTDEALNIKAAVEGPVPTEKKLQSDYWLNRARLEVIEKHTQDALAYYQMSFETRTETPKAYQGKVYDELSDEARALWKQQGGTEMAYALWSHPAGGAEEAKEGRWEKATKKIPDFELSDLSGKTWKLKELGGKTLLINLWATWCGPCQAELPHLEKLYEKVKDRTDIQILTFDIDEDLGVVAPFLKEKGYTFPVLPAYSTVVSLLDGYAIPQSWLVDSHGVWQSKQVGFGGGSDADFEKEMLEHLDAAKGAQ